MKGVLGHPSRSNDDDNDHRPVFNIGEAVTEDAGVAFRMLEFSDLDEADGFQIVR